MPLIRLRLDGSVPDVPGVILQALLGAKLVLEREKNLHG